MKRTGMCIHNEPISRLEQAWAVGIIILLNILVLAVMSALPPG